MCIEARVMKQKVLNCSSSSTINFTSSCTRMWVCLHQSHERGVGVVESFNCQWCRGMLADPLYLFVSHILFFGEQLSNSLHSGENKEGYDIIYFLILRCLNILGFIVIFAIPIDLCALIEFQ